MAGRAKRADQDPAELVACVSAAKRDVLLRVHRHRLGREDLEDCYSQATLELMTRARARDRAFRSEEHIANALEQRFLSRIMDRRRAVTGRSPIAAATEAALRHSDEDNGADGSGLATLADPAADVVGRLAGQEDVRRLREVADELTDDQRLVLACQVALGMECHEFCARFGWSTEKFRKVAQRARARLRVLVADYESGERCRALADDLTAYVGHVAQGEQSDRVRRHLSNCPACAHTARELERVARGVGALLPVPSAVDPEVVHRVGVIGRTLGRLLPFWDTGEGVAAAKAGAAAAGGTGAAAGGASLFGAKLGIVALCAAGAAGGYIACDQVGLFAGPLPRERHRVSAAAVMMRERATRHRSGAPPRAPAPVTHTIRTPVASPTTTRQRSKSPTPSSSSSSGQASGEFGFEAAGAGHGPAPRATSPRPSARAASSGGSPSPATSSSGAKPASSGRETSAEFGFE
jgi:RNA polymerase sigma factor (sigma-70 family)